MPAHEPLIHALTLLDLECMVPLHLAHLIQPAFVLGQTNICFEAAIIVQKWSLGIFALGIRLGLSGNVHNIVTSLFGDSPNKVVMIQIRCANI